MRTESRFLLPVLVVVLVATSSCSKGPERPSLPGKDASAAALALFDLAHEPVIGPGVRDAVLDPALAGRDSAVLDAALAPLCEATDPRVVREEPIPALGLTAVDFAASVPGGGEVLGSVHVRPTGDGTWRIVWIASPGGSWPSKRPGQGEGLTTSSTGR